MTAGTLIAWRASIGGRSQRRDGEGALPEHCEGGEADPAAHDGIGIEVIILAIRAAGAGPSHPLHGDRVRFHHCAPVFVELGLSAGCKSARAQEQIYDLETESGNSKW